MYNSTEEISEADYLETIMPDEDEGLEAFEELDDDADEDDGLDYPADE